MQGTRSGPPQKRREEEIIGVNLLPAKPKREIPILMALHDKLLGEFEADARSLPGAKSLMQHMAQRLHEGMARYNWVGFYLMEVPAFDVLVLGLSLIHI